MRQIFLDTETTGLSPESGDRIIEIGCLEMNNRRMTGETLHFYLNPERRNHPDAVKIHGLTDEFLSDKPLFASIADELLEFVSGAEIIIHNASFDVGFLNEELRRVGRPKFPGFVPRITDSLLMAREMFPGKANSARRAVQAAGSRQLEPRAARRLARRRPARRGLHPHDARAELAGDRWRREQCRAGGARSGGLQRAGLEGAACR